MPSDRCRIHRPGRPRQRGLGLFEVLIACLLLALCAVGAGRALQSSVGAMHDAALHMRAVDLAADLAETLAAATPGQAQAQHLAPWQARLPQHLPAGAAVLRPADAVANTQLLLQWTRGAHPARRISLPLHLPAPDGGGG